MSGWSNWSTIQTIPKTSFRKCVPMLDQLHLKVKPEEFDRVNALLQRRGASGVTAVRKVMAGWRDFVGDLDP